MNDDCVGDLNYEIVVIDERPSAFYFASLEFVGKRPQMRIAEKTAMPKLTIAPASETDLRFIYPNIVVS